MSLHLPRLVPVKAFCPRFGLSWRGMLCLLAASAATAVSAGAAPPAMPTPPTAFAGLWQVRQVLIDERRADRLLYQVNDPRLVGRTVAIEAQQIKADLPEATACPQPGLVPGHVTLNTLLARTMQPELPTAGAARLFDAALPGDRPVDQAWITCNTGTFGPELRNAPPAAIGSPVPGGTWLALLPKGDALMPWYGHTLLVLQRQAADAAVKPSFACAKARLPAEQAICASPALASYDVSLAKGWAYTVQYCDGDAGCIADARQAQKQWVATRNRCGSDQACLRKTMRERLDALMTPTDD